MKNLKDIYPLAFLGEEFILFTFGELPTDNPDFKCFFAHLSDRTVAEDCYHRLLKFSPYNEVKTEEEREYLRQMIYRKIPNEILIEMFSNEE